MSASIFLLVSVYYQLEISFETLSAERKEGPAHCIGVQLAAPLSWFTFEVSHLSTSGLKHFSAYQRDFNYSTEQRTDKLPPNVR